MRSPRRRAGETGVILLVGLAMLVLGAPSVQADDDWEAGQAQRRLERVTAALERETALLEGLATDPRLGGAAGMIDLAGYLADAEVRVWQLQVEAREAVSSVPRGQVTAGEEARTGGVALPGHPEGEAGRGSPADDVAAYRRALGRMVELQEHLGELATASAGGLPPPGRVCPVDGPGHFSHTWGEERPWGRVHKGEDLHADSGTPLVAVESGTIIQSGWHWAGGFGVWLTGYYSGDVYYYAHLMAIAPAVRPGAMVEVGTLLGWVGSTGNATSPHLHFGWIPDNPEHWADLTGLADPYPLLVGLCG